MWTIALRVTVVVWRKSARVAQHGPAILTETTSDGANRGGLPHMSWSLRKQQHKSNRLKQKK